MTTRELIRRVYSEHPCWHFSQVSQAVGVSRQRVHQIVKGEQIVHRGPYRSPRFVCIVCETPFVKRSQRTRLFCSHECWQKHSSVTLVCEVCGTEFQRVQSDVLASLSYSLVRYHNPRAKGEHIFCSKECQGHWLGTLYQRCEDVLIVSDGTGG